MDIDTLPTEHSPSPSPASGGARMPFRLFALKHGDTFLVADAFGDVIGDGDGLFRQDTRVLSRYRLALDGKPPSLLSAAVSQDNVFFTSHSTNRPLPPLGGQSTPEGVIHIERTRFLWEDRLYEYVRLVNYGDQDALMPLTLSFAADFHDMFEVRGSKRQAHGELLPPEVDADTARLIYRGLDGKLRSTALTFSPAPRRLTAERADFLIPLGRKSGTEIYVEIGASRDGEPSRPRFRAAAARARYSMRARRRRGARLRSSGRLFSEWMDKSRADLALLTTELPTGPYPYAGIPWFSTPFGRDAIVTSLQILWLEPSLARGVLSFLAENQARETSRFRSSAPGKIMHETRKGEMTALRELPFGQYYGGVDTTPLFVMLAGAYAERTADLDFVDRLWPALEAAMAWIEEESAGNPDGFLSYANTDGSGLSNQGWKDSSDSVFHADGRFAEPPISLVEVQGYVFAAMRAMAELATRRGDGAAGACWRRRAERLRAAVEQRYWIERIGFYALALDGDGRPCEVRSSNPGHLLFTGLPSPERAAAVARHLLSANFDSGWGVRTLAVGEARFNPMSYHNGSVWPHDTALCAAGLGRYGMRQGAVRLMTELFEAAAQFGMRMPELYCGFQRVAGEPPVAYPVACLPQAWAAGAVFMALQACLGLRIDGWRGEIHVERPRLPPGLDRLSVHGVPLGSERVDLSFQRVGERVVAFPIGGGDTAARIFTRV
ncbi:MAG TPA: amylo-alpha-1,6-glucosidase [Stellaceae bacterium]|nr:amylo-alpha-1,6-glucosidase [Stellaceae bacterium]